MRKKCLYSWGLLGLSLCWFSSESAADELFSSVAIDSVFESKVDSPPVSAKAAKVLTASSMRDLVNAAGYEVTESDSGRVDVAIPCGARKLTLSIRVDQKQEAISLVLALRTLKSENDLSAARLFELLNANRRYERTYFAYQPEVLQLLLQRQILDLRVSSEELKGHLQELAELAESMATAWSDDKTPAGKETPATVPSFNLTGKWSAERSASESFAIQFNQDQSFVLATVIGKTSSRSTGKFLLTDSRLVLSESSGTKVTGTLKFESAGTFLLTLDAKGKSATPLTFKFVEK